MPKLCSAKGDFSEYRNSYIEEYIWCIYWNNLSELHIIRLQTVTGCPFFPNGRFPLISDQDLNPVFIFAFQLRQKQSINKILLWYTIVTSHFISVILICLYNSYNSQIYTNYNITKWTHSKHKFLVSLSSVVIKIFTFEWSGLKPSWKLGKTLFLKTSTSQCHSGVVAWTCNPATSESEFRNSVGSIKVRGNSPLIGRWIVWPPVIQHKERNLAKQGDLT